MIVMKLDRLLTDDPQKRSFHQKGTSHCSYEGKRLQPLITPISGNPNPLNLIVLQQSPACISHWHLPHFDTSKLKLPLG